MPGVNRVLYNLDQRGETTPEERTTARRNIDAISADDVAVLFDDHYKVKQSPINMTFASNAVLRRLWQNPNGEIGAECNYIYNATQDAAGLMGPYDKTKLDGIAYGAEVNVQSDWNTVDDSLDSFIRNKPDLSIFATRTELDGRLQGKQDKLTAGNNITIDANNVISATADPQVQADWAQDDSSAVDYIKNRPQNLVQDPDYVHTDNNFTNADKTKLAGIEAGAEVNVKPDWDAVAGSDAEILNKPQNLVQDANYVHTDNNYTTADKNKLAGIEAGAEANVQADWNTVDNSLDSFIRNKPDLSVYATKSEVASDLAGKQDTLTAGSNISIVNNVISATASPQQQADWAQDDSSAVDYIKNRPDLSVYATKSEVTSGLAGKQDTLTAGSNITIVGNTISATAAPQQQADWAQNDSSAVDYIKNRPQNLVQDANYVHTDNNFTSAEKTKLAGIEAGAEVNVKPDWNAAAGSDAEILNKPTIPVLPPTKNLVAGQGITITPSATEVEISTDAAIPALEWQQTNQGASPTYIADRLTIHQDFHTVTMHGTASGSGSPNLGFLAPPLQSAPATDKVLKVASGSSVPIWDNMPTVDQTYDGTSTNAQSGVAVASAIAGINEVPASSSTDAGKVLTVDAQGVPGWDTASGSSITAGNGITITPGAGSDTVAWQYTVGRNLHINQNNAIQTNLPGTYKSLSDVSGWQEVGDLASSFRIVARLTPKSGGGYTCDLGLRYYASGTGTYFTFIGVQFVTGKAPRNVTTSTANAISTYTEYSNCAQLNTTSFDMDSHESLMLQGTLIAGTLHAFQASVWHDDIAGIRVAFTAIEVGKVGATN